MLAAYCHTSTFCVCIFGVHCFISLRTIHACSLRRTEDVACDCTTTLADDKIGIAMDAIR